MKYKLIFTGGNPVVEMETDEDMDEVLSHILNNDVVVGKDGKAVNFALIAAVEKVQ